MENTMLHTSQHTSGSTSQFKFDFLKKITNDFSKDRIIGCGAYGVVYKGVMDNGQEIAVKKLINRPLDHDSEKQFHNECTNLMRVQHQNIVRLVGYCDETYRRCVKYDGEYVFADENERALCFEYLGGSLDKYVSDEPCRLDWDICYKIIKGVCEGLNHLHNGHRESIFHLDLKPANILLDNNMNPKIGDFGLSRLFSTTGTCTITTPLGTMGYIPPEFVDKQEISPKYDVFSLGVVIIHIMAGRKHYYDHVDTPAKIFELVCENWGLRLHATMWSHASLEVKMCIQMALRCVKSDRHERPTISMIVDDLNRIDIGKLPHKYESTSLQIMEAVEYNQYTTSVSMGVHDNANDRSMHDPMDYLQESIMREPASIAIGGNASTAVSQPRDVTRIIEVDTFHDGHRRRNPHLRMEVNTNGANGSGDKSCGPLMDYHIPDYILKPDSEQVILDNAPCCPVVVFINSRSGGQLGSGLIKTYRELLNEAQVFDLSEESPDKVLHRLYANFEKLKSNGDILAVEIERNLRLIVAGGDGTASWLLGVVSDLKLSHSPPVATVPLGTGNNLPFSFGWGKKNPATDQEAVKSFLGLVKGAKEMNIDSWHIIMRMRAPKEGPCDPIAPLELPHSLHAFHRVSGSDSLNVEGYHTFRGGFWNYFSMGMDAQVSYGFHSERKKNPEKFKNQLTNQGTYAKLVLKEGWFAPSRGHNSSRYFVTSAAIVLLILLMLYLTSVMPML